MRRHRGLIAERLPENPPLFPRRVDVVDRRRRFVVLHGAVAAGHHIGERRLILGAGKADRERVQPVPQPRRGGHHAP